MKRLFVKNATLAIDTTDKINFEIDDFIDDTLPFTTLGGYELSSDIMQEAFDSLRGG